MRGLIGQTYAGFYGDGDKHAAVDVQLCASVIEHSHGFCNHLIEQDDGLSGFITDLTTSVSLINSMWTRMWKQRWTRSPVHGMRRTQRVSWVEAQARDRAAAGAGAS
jgi:hypothetical protein